MDPLVYTLFFLVAFAICAAATLVAPGPRRPCPRCEVDIALSARRCRSCGYWQP
jgi:hypothetical protein